MVIPNQMVIPYSSTLQKYHQVINSNHHLRKRYHQVRYHHLRSPSSALPSERHNPVYQFRWIKSILGQTIPILILITNGTRQSMKTKSIYFNQVFSLLNYGAQQMNQMINFLD